MATPPHPVKDSPANLLKRKRELLPLGAPPPPPDAPPSPSEQRPALRANRACNTCRRQKMRCDGLDSYPCSRCKNAGLECIFEKVPPNKDQVVSTTRRIESLEKTMEAIRTTQLQMNASIQEILHELRGRPVTSAPCVISVEESPDQAKPTAHSSLPAETLSSSFASLGTSATPFPPTKAVEEIPHFTSPTLFGQSPLPPISSLLTPSVTPPEYPFASSALLRTPVSLEDGEDSPYPEHSTHQNAERSFTRPSRRPGTWLPQGTPTQGLADYARSHPVKSAGPHSISTAKAGVDQDNKRPYLGRSNASPETSVQPTATNHPSTPHMHRKDRGNRVWNPEDNVREFRAEDRPLLDVVDRGLITEQEAHCIFTLFFEYCHPRMPIFDPKTDDFQSLRQRSPFCFCCVLMVAAKARDGGNQPSTLQLSLWDEAMLRAKDSMFHRVKGLETVQGLLLLSAWSESTGAASWILAGHAIRCGVELGIHKSLSKLASETNNDEIATHSLVCSARVWCALFAFEHQLSLGMGRFTMTGSSKMVKTARETLLHNAFSTPNDMRLVSACEIMTLEYQILESLSNIEADDPRCQEILEDGRARIHTWHAEWDALLSAIFSREHYMRQMVDVYQCYAYMTIHLTCMPRNVAAADLGKLSQCERDNCFRAVSAARDIVKISVEKQSYRDGLQYSPPWFSSGVSFVGALILRLGSILSEEESTLSLAENLSQILNNVPTCRFKFSFMTLLEEHQKEAHRKNT